MSESSMIERVARALARTRVYEGYNAETRARMIEREMDGARRDVRFVLEAMREPTEAMLLNRYGEDTGVEGPSLPETRRAWRAMIDAALSEQRGPADAQPGPANTSKERPAE